MYSPCYIEYSKMIPLSKESRSKYLNTEIKFYQNIKIWTDNNIKYKKVQNQNESEYDDDCRRMPHTSAQKHK